MFAPKIASSICAPNRHLRENGGKNNKKEERFYIYMEDARNFIFFQTKETIVSLAASKILFNPFILALLAFSSYAHVNYKKIIICPF